jgi:SAM-dependent methyltransferase
VPKDYLIDRELDEARRRLDLLEALDDPGTFRHLETIGVAEGWRCLEVGAGGGSVAAWLAERVGPTGRVVATDLDPRFLAKLDRENLEVRRHDVATDPLETDAFDLVHARSVLMHVPHRDAALAKLARAVKPGGWMLLEEPDATCDGPDPEAAEASGSLYRKVTATIYDFLREREVDPFFGRELYGRVEGLGFEAVRGEGRLQLFRGGSEPSSPHMPAFAELKDQVVAEGRVSGEEYDEFLALADDPGFLWREAMTMSVFGRRST